MSTGELPISQWPTDLTDYPTDWSQFFVPAGDDVPAGATPKALFADFQRLMQGRVANTTTLRAIDATNIPTGTRLTLDGHTNEGVGGGLLRLDKSGTIGANVDDNGLYFHAAGGPAVTDPFAWYWVRTDTTLTPEMYGAGVVAGDESAALQAWLNAPAVYRCELNGSYIGTGLTLTVPDKQIDGTGTIRLADNSVELFLLDVQSTKCKLRNFNLRGNTTNPPLTEGKPLIVSGDDNYCENLGVFDARSQAPDTDTSQNNIHDTGQRNIFIGCRSENAGYSNFFHGGANSNGQFRGCYGRNNGATAIARGFNGSGGSSNDGMVRVLDGMDLDSALVADWATNQSPKLIETLIVTNCHIKAPLNIGAKFAHARRVFVDNCLIHSDRETPGGSGNEGLVFGERLYEFVCTNSHIKAGPAGTATSSHVDHFPEGSIQRSLNFCAFHNCIFGGSGEQTQPSNGWDNIAINVRAFHFTMTHCQVHHFRQAGLFIWPDVTNGVLGIRTTAPPAATGSGNSWIVGPGSDVGEWAAVPLNSIATDILTGEPPSPTWVFEAQDTDLKYGTRVFNEDAAVKDWIEYIDSARGWQTVPDQSFGLDIHDNHFYGYSNTEDVSMIADTGSSGDFQYVQNRLLYNASRVKFYGNEIVNLGTQGTEITASSTMREVYQQYGPNRWYTTTSAPPTGGIWFRGAQVDSQVVADTSVPGWVRDTTNTQWLRRQPLTT